MFLRQSDDNTGKIEEIVDEKLATSGFTTIATVNELISEAQLSPGELDEYLKKTEAQSTYYDKTTIDGKLDDIIAGEFDPSVLDDYALAGHTHTTINNALTVNGDLSSKGSLNLNGTQSGNAGPNIYMGTIEMRTAENTLNTWVGGAIKQTINADGVKVNGTLNGYTIGTSDNSDNKNCIVTIDKTHGIADIGRFLDFHYPKEYPDAGDWCVRLQCDTGNKLALYGPSSTSGSHLAISFNTKADGTTIVKDNLQVDKNTTVGTLNGFTIGTVNNSSNENRIVTVKDDYTCDIGRFLDFHNAEHGETCDRCARLQADGTGGGLSLYDGSGNNAVTLRANPAHPSTFRQNVDISKDLTVTGKITCANIDACNQITVKNSKKNDTAHFYVGGTDDNDTFLEIATTDNGNEPIYMRQYNSNKVLAHSATILDADGNTSFPGTLSAGGKEVATKEYVDEKIAEIEPSGTIEVINNDLTVNGKLTVKKGLVHDYKVWAEKDDYVHNYGDYWHVFPMEYNTHDDTSDAVLTIGKNIVKALHTGDRILGEWTLRCFLDSEGTSRTDPEPYAFDYIFTAPPSEEVITINDYVSFRADENNYYLKLDNTMFRWSQYYGFEVTLFTCKIYEQQDRKTTLIDENGNTILPGRLQVNQMTNMNSDVMIIGNLLVSGKISEIRPQNSENSITSDYATESYVDEKTLINVVRPRALSDYLLAGDVIEKKQFQISSNLSLLNTQVSIYISCDIAASQGEGSALIIISPEGNVTMDHQQFKTYQWANSDHTVLCITFAEKVYWVNSVTIVAAPQYFTETVPINSVDNVLYTKEAVDEKITEITGNQTVTHKTNVTGEIGTFCETNGGIYDGYEKVGETDCICQVVQSNTLNDKIVGVITSPTQFASHGDVLMKVVPGTYKLGDILAPDITGRARVATDTELQYMMLHAIPRPKITSLATGMENTVACFIV